MADLSTTGSRDFVVGITGHRPDGLSPEALESLPQRLGRIFEQFRRALATAAEASNGGQQPSTYVASALAEGADRIAAHAAMSAGFKLIAILPFAAAAYEKDFLASASRAEFYELLGKASKVVILAPSPADDIARNRGYRAAGLAVVRSCDVLVAVWDGLPARGEGGTGDIVQAALAKAVPVIWMSACEDASAKLLLRESELPSDLQDCDVLAVIAQWRARKERT